MQGSRRRHRTKALTQKPDAWKIDPGVHYARLYLHGTFVQLSDASTCYRLLAASIEINIAEISIIALTTTKTVVTVALTVIDSITSITASTFFLLLLCTHSEFHWIISFIIYTTEKVVLFLYIGNHIGEYFEGYSGGYFGNYTGEYYRDTYGCHLDNYVWDIYRSC